MCSHRVGAVVGGDECEVAVHAGLSTERRDAACSRTHQRRDAFPVGRRSGAAVEGKEEDICRVAHAVAVEVDTTAGRVQAERDARDVAFGVETGRVDARVVANVDRTCTGEGRRRIRDCLDLHTHAAVVHRLGDGERICVAGDHEVERLSAHRLCAARRLEIVGSNVVKTRRRKRLGGDRIAGIANLNDRVERCVRAHIFGGYRDAHGARPGHAIFDDFLCRPTPRTRIAARETEVTGTRLRHRRVEHQCAWRADHGVRDHMQRRRRAGIDECSTVGKNNRRIRSDKIRIDRGLRRRASRGHRSKRRDEGQGRESVLSEFPHKTSSTRQPS